MTVTIVGITGNIGRHLAAQALERGMAVRGVAPDADAVSMDARVHL